MPSTIHVFSDRFDASLSFQSNIPPGSEELIIRGTGTLSHGVPMACSIISFRCTFGQHVSCHWAGADGSLYCYSMRDDVAPSLPEWIHLRMSDVAEAKLLFILNDERWLQESSLLPPGAREHRARRIVSICCRCIVVGKFQFQDQHDVIYYFVSLVLTFGFISLPRLFS